MRFQRFDDRYMLRLEPGEQVIESLTAFLREQAIPFASVSAAGAVEWVRLGYWNPETKEYEYRDVAEQLEVVSFQGNAARKDRAPFLHIHGVFGRRDFTVCGGHVKEARVRPTLEVWLRAETITVQRTRDPATGLDLLDLPQHVGPTR